MTSEQRMSVAIVGCGYQGTLFAQSLAASDQWQVVACADPDEEAASLLARLAGGVPAFRSVEDLLAGSDVSAVVIATSHDALSASALAAMQAGKHVLMEKPLGLDEAQVIGLESAAAASEVCCMAGYSFRYLAGLQKVRELLEAGATGEIHSIQGAIGVGPMIAGWKARRDLGGGPLLYVGSHLIDQMIWYLGDEPAEVSAEIRYAPGSDVDETTNFQLRFRRGCVAQGFVTQTAHAGLNSHLGIYGRQGRVTLRGVGFTYGVEVASAALPGFMQPTSFQLPQTEDHRHLMHQPQLAEFARAIRERRQPSCTLAEARRVSRVLDGIVMSANSGHPVRFDS